MSSIFKLPGNLHTDVSFQNASPHLRSSSVDDIMSQLREVTVLCTRRFPPLWDCVLLYLECSALCHGFDHFMSHPLDFFTMTKMGPGLIADNGLANEKRVRILGVIDKIRELGVSEDISLPQVCLLAWSQSGPACKKLTSSAACRSWRPVEWKVVGPRRTNWSVIPHRKRPLHTLCYTDRSSPRTWQ